MDHDLNTCTSGGVELFGTHLVVVPRRVQQSAPMLEEYCFVPNLSDIPCETNLTNYLNTCSVYSVQRLQTLCNTGSRNLKLDSVKLFLDELYECCKPYHKSSSKCELLSGDLYLDLKKLLKN